MDLDGHDGGGMWIRLIFCLLQLGGQSGYAVCTRFVMDRHIHLALWRSFVFILEYKTFRAT